jgi:hypothetical protein
MAEPENHPLRLLREFREEFSEFRADFNVFRGATRSEIADFRSETADKLAEIKESTDSLTRAVAGEIVQGRYVTAGVDQKFAEIERRLSALEQAK